MSGGPDSTIYENGAKVEFFVSDRDGARELRERSYDLSHRLLNTLSVQFELSRAPYSSSQGEWVLLKGPRDNLDKAKVSFVTERERERERERETYVATYVRRFVCPSRKIISSHGGLAKVCQHFAAVP